MSIKLTFDFTNEAEAMAFLKKVSLAEAPADPTPAKPAKATKPAKSATALAAAAAPEAPVANTASAAPAANAATTEPLATETALRAALTKLQSTKGLDVAKAILALHGGTVSACLKLGAQNKVIAECAKAQ
jgi:hypothetical protein